MGPCFSSSLAVDALDINVFEPRATPSLSKDAPTSFKLSDILIATNGFNESYILGRGGFGAVYSGVFYFEGTEETQVAIKRLSKDSKQGQVEWLTEIVTLGRLNHPNLVKLYGYCAEEGEGILVYEYLEKESLDYHLFSLDDSPAPFPPLPLEIRIKIVNGIAHGLEYLHRNNIIHRDFKTPNVLLDKDYNPKITDFGLARFLNPEATHASTRIMGTLGYIDPKFCLTGQLTKLSDVYSFGIMLLELMTGRKAKQDDVSITNWVAEYMSQEGPKMELIFDPFIHAELSSGHMLEVAKRLTRIAWYCVKFEPSTRPSMVEVLDYLSEVMKMV